MHSFCQLTQTSIIETSNQVCQRCVKENALIMLLLMRQIVFSSLLFSNHFFPKVPAFMITPFYPKTTPYWKFKFLQLYMKCVFIPIENMKQWFEQHQVYSNIFITLISRNIVLLVMSTTDHIKSITFFSQSL